MGSERGPDQGDEGDHGVEGDDPFEGLTLDESFVRAAPVREPAAAERERAARQANLSRLLADEAAQRENREHERRRYAPSDDAGSDDWDDWDVSAARRRRRRPLQLVALFVVIALVLVYVVSDYLRSGDPAAGSGTPAGSASTGPETENGDRTGRAATSSVPAGSATAVRPDEWPPLPDAVSDVPLGTPGPVPAGGGPHTFVVMQEDRTTPVGYDPCRPIAYRTRPGGPDAGPQLVREAVAMVSAASGLQFIDEGATDEAPSAERAAYQPERYGERWAPVLIAWSDATESPELGRVEPAHPLADVAGYAGSQPMGFSTTDPSTGGTTNTGLVFVTGSVVLDAPDLTAMLAQPDGYARARAVVVHELGHLVGLGHVADPAQLMQPQTSDAVTGFGAGDLEGLARLGTLACFPEI